MPSVYQYYDESRRDLLIITAAEYVRMAGDDGDALFILNTFHSDSGFDANLWQEYVSIAMTFLVH